MGDHVSATISLLGRGCGALGAESANKSSPSRLFLPFVRYLRQLEIEPAYYSISGNLAGRLRLFVLLRQLLERPGQLRPLHERLRTLGAAAHRVEQIRAARPVDTRLAEAAEMCVRRWRR